MEPVERFFDFTTVMAIIAIAISMLSIVISAAVIF
jgi:hypothetical protein